MSEQLPSEQCDDIDPPPPECTGAPLRIWLVVGDLEEDCKFDDLGEDVSWCSDPIGNQDIEYVRADHARAQERRIAELVRVIERLGSNEAFLASRPLDKERDDELIARMEYARDQLARIQA